MESSSLALAASLGGLLSSPPRRLAVAESCTGGLLSAAVTAVPGASAYFPGAVVAYDNVVKVRELGVPEALLASVGAVSRETALAMAEGVRLRFGADIGLSTTGIAGPSGGTPEKPVGTVWVAVSAEGVAVSNLLRLPGDRDAVRRETVLHALALLVSVLSGREGG